MIRHRLYKIYGVIIRALPIPRGKSLITNLFFPNLRKDENFKVFINLKKLGQGKIYCYPYDSTQYGLFLYGHNKAEQLSGVEQVLLESSINKKIIFDVGANIGYYSIKFSNLIHPSGQVHAFEPIPITFKRFEDNIHLNQINNIVLNQLVVSNKFDRFKISYSPSHSGASSIKDSGAEQFMVESITLDNYCKNKEIAFIDVMKIDVEGHELNVLKGLKSTLSNQKIGMLFIEIVRKHLARHGTSPEEVLSFLRNLGYIGYKIGRRKDMQEYQGTSDEDLVIFISEKD